MAVYRRVSVFGHLWADCRGPGLALKPYAHFEYGTTFTFLPLKRFDAVDLAMSCKEILLQQLPIDSPLEPFGGTGLTRNNHQKSQ